MEKQKPFFSPLNYPLYCVLGLERSNAEYGLALTKMTSTAENYRRIEGYLAPLQMGCRLTGKGSSQC